jgi:hypothetical protein
MFEPGQFVLCVDDEWTPQLGPPPLKRGRVYTVDSVYENGLRAWSLTLREASPPAPFVGGFGARRFRLLLDSRLDVFRTALEPMKEEAR